MLIRTVLSIWSELDNLGRRALISIEELGKGNPDTKAEGVVRNSADKKMMEVYLP